MLLKIVGCVSSAMLLGSIGTAYSYRRHLVSIRRAELRAELDQLHHQSNEVVRIQKADLDDHVRAVKNAAELAQVVETLWTDRFDRYHESLQDNRSVMSAVPESISVVKGLTAHYDHTARTMSKFVRFDFAASKVILLMLLIKGSNTIGLKAVAPLIARMFRGEDLLLGVCLHLDEHCGTSDVPENIGDLSRTFQFCMIELHRSIDGANQMVEKKSEDPHVNLISRSSSALLQYAVLDVHPTSSSSKSDPPEAVDGLTTTNDVTSAIEYVKGLQAMEHHDGRVRASVVQLGTWAGGATAFLVQQQGLSVLQSYKVLLAETLVRVDAVA